jgi:tripartite ATP-independent transporter DctM subunit
VTPSEAGILASVYAIVIGFIYRTLSWKKLHNALLVSLNPIAQIMFLIAMAGAMRWLIAAERVPITVGEWVLAVSAGKPFVFLLMINGFYLVMGCFMHGLSTLIITLPIFLPLLETFHIDPVHFGVITVFNAMIGMCTPPVGMGLFTITSVTDVKYEDVVRKIYPLVAALLVALLVITFVPQVSLWLPNLLMGK